MRAALYARVSTEDKDQDPELQLVALRRYCKAMGWEIHEEYVDKHSAYRNAEERPEFNRMLRDARLRKFDVLLVYNLDRFSRENPLKVHQYFYELVELNKIRFISVSDGLDSNNPAWTLILGVLSWMANNYSRMLGLKVKAGLEKARRQGKKLGRPNKVTPELAEKMRELRAQGWSISQLQKKYKLGRATIHRIVKDVPKTPSNPK